MPKIKILFSATSHGTDYGEGLKGYTDKELNSLGWGLNRALQDVEEIVRKRVEKRIEEVEKLKAGSSDV